MAENALGRVRPTGVEQYAEPLQYVEPLRKEPRFQLADALLDCVLVASFSMPPELQCMTSLTGPIRISVELAEARVRYLRAAVPQLRDRDDVTVLRLDAEAWKAYADALKPQVWSEVRAALNACVDRFGRSLDKFADVVTAAERLVESFADGEAAQ